MEALKSLSSYMALIPILPLLGAMFNGFYTFSGVKQVKKLTHTVACLAILSSFIIALGTYFQLLSLPETSRSISVTLFPWIHAGAINLDVTFTADPLSILLMLVITGVGFLIHLYSIGYMSHEHSYSRYFTYLNLFCFAMLLLVMGGNLMMMFIGWEGVGVCSYLLIGFWFSDIDKASAGMKAFVVNRVGDFAFISGALLLYWTLHSLGKPTLDFAELKEVAPLLANLSWGGVSIVTIICLLFFVGATGKSAQIPLFVWLPDAMAGPTPVSALIHAATMVTAGVYMIARLSFIFSMSEVALTVIAVVGFSTAFFAAIIGFAQNDIKKVLAYSTVSQLGFMFGAMGVGAYTAGVFHLLTHAFFKACLFLGSGSVIHAMSGEQDMRKMGGLKSHLPITYKTFLIATLAIAGIFPFAGFFSKDEILWHAFNQFPILWLVGVVSALGTAIYMFRLVTMTFYGECRADEETKHHIHESPWTMTVPLMVLAFLSIAGGFIGVPEALGHLVGWHDSHILEAWLAPALTFPEGHEHEASHAMEYLLMALSLGIAMIGCTLGYKFYSSRKDIPENFVAKHPVFHRIVYNKFYVDEIYKKVFVDNLLRLNNFLSLFDAKVIDGVVNGTAQLTKILSSISGWFDRVFVDGAVNLIATLSSLGGAILKRIQSGQLQGYLYVAVAIVVIILGYRVL